MADVTVRPFTPAQPKVTVAGGVVYAASGAPHQHSYTHTQSSASTVWTIPHNLNLTVPPTVSVFSPGGVHVRGVAVATSSDVVVVYFNNPTAGTARVSP